MTQCNTQCNNCGTDLTGLPHHSGERGLAYCCLCAHPGEPCPPTDTGKPSNALPGVWQCPFESERIREYPGCFEDCPDTDQCCKKPPSNALPDVPGALNTQGRESPKKRIPGHREKTSLATQSTKAGVGASGQAEALTPGKTPPEGESGKGTILQGEDGHKISPVERGKQAWLNSLKNKERSIMAEKPKTRRRRKALLNWSIMRWCAQDGYEVNLKERGYELSFPDGKTVICASFIEAKARAELYARQKQEIAELDLKFAEDVE